MENPQMQPTKNRVILRKADERLSEGGIVLPKTEDDDGTGEAVVVCAGPEATVKPGDKVLHASWQVQSFRHEGQDLFVVNECDLLAVIDE